MSLSRARQRQIMRDDAKRRNARAAADLEAIVASHSPLPTVDQYHHSRGITGVPSENNRVHRASVNCWERGMRGRTVGVAPGTTVDSFTVPTVAVTINGKTTVRNVSEYRRPRNVTRTKTVQVAHTPEVLRMAATVGYIGNVE